jgi:hypothetical protein
MTTEKKGAFTAILIYMAAVALTAILFIIALPLENWSLKTIIGFCSLIGGETALWLFAMIITRRKGDQHSIPSNLSLLIVVAGYTAVSIILSFITFIPLIAYVVIHAITLLITVILGGLLYAARRKMASGFRRDAERTAGWSSIIAASTLVRAKLEHWEPDKRKLLQKEVDELADIIKYSDPATIPALAELEYTLHLDLQVLSQMIDANREQPLHSSKMKELQQKVIETVNEAKLRNLQLASMK